MPKDGSISMSVVRRLPRYYRFLYYLKCDGVLRISSGELAARMGLTASQIRQDLNCFGGFGQQGYGYLVDQLYDEIGRILGVHTLSPAVIVGVGNMGRAIANYMDFESRGLRIVGLFDISPAVVGQAVRGLAVQPLEQLEAACRAHGVRVAILCIPNEAADDMARRLMDAGVNGFWNFTHYDVARHHPGSVVENVHLDDSLMTLSYRLTKPEGE